MVAPLLQQWRISGSMPTPLRALELRLRKIRVGSVDGIRDREMHENSLDEKLGHLRNFLQLLDRLRVVIGKEAEARHARIQLDVDLEAAL